MEDSVVAAVHVEPFRVRFDEAGADGTLRTSAYMRYMQDAASVHSSNAGYTRDWYRAAGIFWVVRHLDLHIHAPSTVGEVLAVSTEVVGFRRIWARRRSEFRAEDGRLTAEAAIDWVLTTASGRPTSVPPEIVQRFPALVTDYAPARLRFPEAPRSASQVQRRVEPHELDPMAHLNNAAYIDQFEAAIEGTGGASLRTAIPRRVRIEFLVPAPPDGKLIWRVWPIGSGRAGLLTDDTGTELARVLAETG